MRVTASPEQIKLAFEAVKDDLSSTRAAASERGRPPVEMIQECPSTEDSAWIRRVRGLRLSRWPAGAAGQGAGDHHVIEDADCRLRHALRPVAIADIVADPLVAIGRIESLVPRERIAVAYARRHDPFDDIPEPLARELREHFTDRSSSS